MESPILTFLDRKTQRCKEVSLVYEFHAIPMKIGTRFIKNNFLSFFLAGRAFLQLLFVAVQGFSLLWLLLLQITGSPARRPP